MNSDPSSSKVLVSRLNTLFQRYKPDLFGKRAVVTRLDVYHKRLLFDILIGI